ncbi:TetR/AcrR family transcriptional regulator [Kordiimonas laminariae]|uniref:TetR/AcrR family transcriptional regulator n=1 Tax=Kordiimonas laminariae TaxID=2917717 RepID=UPI001FF3362B|nr:TetR/AcrR family transcriptional regulator [Kordiimonas laminariae]MCK0068955.1 TetR/AcrR family transcriptional regulator [Kordiimonas laminariae]
MSIQEKRQQREQLILDHAISLIEEAGFFSMKMSDLAKRAKLSVGTLYSHYPCKEDLLIALAIKFSEQHLEWFKNSQKFGNTPAEKLIAACLNDMVETADQVAMSELAHLSMAPSIWKRASPLLTDRLHSFFNEAWQLFSNLVAEAAPEFGRDAFTEKENRSLNLGCWSLAVGIDALTFSSIIESETANVTQTNFAREDWGAIFIENLAKHLTGWGWTEPNPIEKVTEIFDTIQNSQTTSE